MKLKSLKKYVRCIYVLHGIEGLIKYYNECKWYRENSEYIQDYSYSIRDLNRDMLVVKEYIKQLTEKEQLLFELECK